MVMFLLNRLILFRYATDWLYNNGSWPAAFVGAAYVSNMMISDVSPHHVGGW